MLRVLYSNHTTTPFFLVGLSNFFFYQEAGYFDYDKFFKPLLHTWSLAVEIQYYIIWPIILLIIIVISRVDVTENNEGWKHFVQGLFLAAPVSFFAILVSLGLADGFIEGNFDNWS